MPAGYIFWLLMILVAVFGAGFVRAGDGPQKRYWLGGWGIVVFVLFFLLGWKVFGFVIQ